ncbi:MAG: phosphoribosylanthranilate isomerase [Kiritimatiellae bacterium]|nr:phosphoribosylanthranilate isomerase [Kiritimatiellia bacterium]MDD4736196.1 phosphoribosylanthranilate isomerase [Kiritimatiellia bacterium]
MSVAVKICGLTNYEDARFAMQCGADYLGFILVPETSRYISPAKIKKILSALPKQGKTVGVFMNEPPERVIDILKETGLDIAQLHGEEGPDEIKSIGAERVWKVVTVSTSKIVTSAVKCKSSLLVADSIVQGRRGGGTGVVCDWSLAAQLASKRDILLAGGLHPDNVVEAIRQVRPYGVDVSSGVEKARGVKDHEKVRAFIERAKAE